MTSSHTLTRWTATLALAATTLAACGKDKAAARDTTGVVPPGAVPTPPPANAAVTVADVDMGKHIGPDKKITDKTDDFGTRDTIYASAHTSGTGTGQTLSAKWTFENGSTVDEHSETISPTGDAYTEFHIVKPSGWPKGKYTLHLFLNGAEVQTKDVTVK